MHHRSAISYDVAFKCCECDNNVLHFGISLAAGLAILHNRRFIFEPKSTRTELIECNIDSYALGS